MGQRVPPRPQHHFIIEQYEEDIDNDGKDYEESYYNSFVNGGAGGSGGATIINKMVAGTYTMGSPVVSSKQVGWVCPECGAGVSPYEKNCLHPGQAKNSMQSVPVQKQASSTDIFQPKPIDTSLDLITQPTFGPFLTPLIT